LWANEALLENARVNKARYPSRDEIDKVASIFPRFFASALGLRLTFDYSRTLRFVFMYIGLRFRGNPESFALFGIVRIQ
jgi:hypothetical protein